MSSIVWSFILASVFICGLNAHEFRGTGFRTRSHARSNVRDLNEENPSSALRRSQSQNLASFAQVPGPFGDFASAGEKMFKDGGKTIQDGGKMFTDGLNEVQKNMLKMWEAYSNGMKETSEKMMGVMSDFGVPKDFIKDPFSDKFSGKDSPLAKFLSVEKAPDYFQNRDQDRLD